MRKVLAFLLGLLVPALAGAVQYAQCPYGAVCRIPFSLYDYTDPTQHETTASVAIVTGDVHWYCGGTTPTEDNTTILTGDISETGTYGFELELGATETDCDRIKIDIIDATATEVWFPHTIVIDTYGNALAGVPGVPTAAPGANGGVATSDGTNLVQTVDVMTDTVTLDDASLTNAKLAGNLEVVFETDFATNYNATRNAWATNLQDTVGAGNLTADLRAVNADITVAGNMETLFGTHFANNYDSTARSYLAKLDQDVTHGGGTTTRLVLNNSGGTTSALECTGNASADCITVTAGSGQSGITVDAEAGAGGNALNLLGDTYGLLASASTAGAKLDGYDFGAGVKIAGGTTSGDALDLSITSGKVVDYGGTELMAAIGDQAQPAIFLNCEVNTANFAGDNDEFACILTDRDGTAASGIATNDLIRRVICATSGTEEYNCRYIVASTWDGTNSELQLRVDGAWAGGPLADAVTLEIK